MEGWSSLKRSALCLLSLLLLSTAVWAEANPQKQVTLTFKDADLHSVLDTLAREMDAYSYIAPTVKGSVTIDMRNIPADEAVRRVLASQTTEYGFVLLKDVPVKTAVTLVVAAPEDLADLTRSSSGGDPARAITRGEYLLEDAPAGRVLDFLKTQFPDVEFTPHPIMNGFYALGPLEELLHIKRGLANLDRSWCVPPPPPPEVEEGYQLEVEPGEAESRTGYREVVRRPLSTFPIKVETESYAQVRHFLKDGMMPVAQAVRIEELVNEFRYGYPEPAENSPFAVATELSVCPWNSEHQLFRVGVQGRRAEAKATPPRNLVFLLDMSGYLNYYDRFPLVRKSLRFLLDTLNKQDHIAIVVYGEGEGLTLPSTRCDKKSEIAEKIALLEPAYSTDDSAGIRLAYEVARQNFQKGAINRVILCTAVDIKVGLTGDALEAFIEKERENGIFLTVLNFGTGSTDGTLEALADKGHGNYAHIDRLLEAQKALVRESGGTLDTIAKDVKLQIEFNPKRVHSYRLVGYENRPEDKEISVTKVDADELVQSGHSVTALYELVPDGPPAEGTLRYQHRPATTEEADRGELAVIKLRYKEEKGEASKVLELPVSDRAVSFGDASPDHRFAASVAAFGLVLQDSEFKGEADLSKIRLWQWAGDANSKDPDGYRQEFFQLVKVAETLKNSAKR